MDIDNLAYDPDINEDNDVTETRFIADQGRTSTPDTSTLEAKSLNASELIIQKNIKINKRPMA